MLSLVAIAGAIVLQKNSGRINSWFNNKKKAKS